MGAYLRSPRWHGAYEIGDPVIFPAQTIDTAGSRVDATVGPSYLVFEDENPVAVDGGVMTLLGAVGTGIYSESVTLTDPPYSAGHRYTISMTATVDGEDPADFWVFDVVAASSAPPDINAIADQVWDEAKADHQGATIMGNIAEDTDNLDFTSTPG